MIRSDAVQERFQHSSWEGLDEQFPLGGMLRTFVSEESKPRLHVP